MTPSAASVRSSVERGDPLALRQLLTMGRDVTPSARVGTPGTLSPATGARRPVAVDAARYAPDERVQFTPLAGEDSAAMEHNPIIYPSDYVSTSDGRQWTMPLGLPSMRLPRGSRWTYAELDTEHERQSRLSRWQALGSQR